MASTDQPLKKRKLYDPSTPHNQPSTPPPPPPLSQDDIIRRRRNRDEIRNLYDCYRRIKFCVSHKDARHLMPDFEQAYLSLITASRGCTSVQRIVAELIPRYASFCPTALEAAAKVSINMYNWSLSIIMRGEDVDGVAYETAKACIFGLVDICCTASYEAPTSSVIRGICSAVFQNVLTFFTSTLEGKDIYQLGSKEIQKLQESMEFIDDLKQEPADDNEPPLYKLFKFRALSLLRIFFLFPKNLLAACFEILASNGTDVANLKGTQYFLNQLIGHLNSDQATHSPNKLSDGAQLCTGSAQGGTDGKGSNELKPISEDTNVTNKLLLLSENCFIGMAIEKEPSLRVWMLSRYKKLCESHNSEDVSGISSFLEKIFGPLAELVEEADPEESDKDDFDPSKYINHPYEVYKNTIQHADNVDSKDHSARVHGTSVSDTLCRDSDAAKKDSGQYVKPHELLLPLKVDGKSCNDGLAREGERPISITNLEMRDLADSCPDSTSPKDLTSKQIIPVVCRKQGDINVDDPNVGNHVFKVEKFSGSNIDFSLPARLSASGSAPTFFSSPRQHSAAQSHASSNQILWYIDGDHAAMDVFSATKQLWVGSLGHDASEMSVRLQFEDFGPLEQFIFHPNRDFALMEYRNIMDAVKAREYMQGSSPWGDCLSIKFLDRGLGSRGAANGVAVGDSCHVYIGKVTTHWAKDEILHELMMAGLRNPRMITDLTSESALLLEFWTSEEAASAMAHVRCLRKGMGRHTYPDRSPTLRPYSKDKFASSFELLVRQIDTSVTDEELINAFSRYGELTRWQFNRPGCCCWMEFRSYEAADLARSHLHGARIGSTCIIVEFSSGYFQSHGDLYSSGSESKSLNLYPSPFRNKSEGSFHELVSPRVKMEKIGTQARDGYAFQPNWVINNTSEMQEVGSRKIDDFGSSTHMDHSFTGPVTPHGAEQIWQHKKQEFETQMLAQGSLPCPPGVAHGGSVVPPPIQASSFVRPIYFNPSSSWDSSTLNSSLPLNQIPRGMMPVMPTDNHHVNPCRAVPFISSSVTPLSHMAGGSMQRFDQMVTVPGLPNLTPPPPQSDVPPPLPFSPPPLPPSQPPSVPPPPSSPPPLQRVLEPLNLQLEKPCVQYQWQGTLSKSGVHYCTIYATREESAACKYSNSFFEPIEWPSRLDVTKRTDLRHVKTTFASTRPHKREVCRLLPSSPTDEKGFHDFISYLKQRECAGVIKIPAGKSIWARLLFILPHSPDTCSLLDISLHPFDCLIALILPKDTNPEGA